MRINKKSILNNLLLLSALFLTIFAESKHFSFFINNIIPVRALLPFISFLLVSINFNKNTFKQKYFKIYNLLFLFFISVLLFSLTYTLDIRTGLGILFFWINLYFFGVSIFFIRTSLDSLFFLKTYGIVYFLLAFTASIIKYIIFLSGNNPIFFPGYFTEDGNHLAFISGVFILIFFYCFCKSKTTKNSIFYFISLLLTFILHFSCSGTGATFILLFLITFCGFYFLINKQFSYFKKFLVLLAISALAVFIWNLLPRTHYTESPFFTQQNIEIKNENPQSELNSVDILTKNTDGVVNSFRFKSNYSLKFYSPDRVLHFYRTFKNLPASVFAHATLVYSGVILFLNKPLLGWGLGSFNEAMRDTGMHSFFTYFDPSAASVDNYPAHNMYTNYLSETGITGFFGYIGTFLFLMFLVFKKFKESNYGLLYFIYLLCYLYYFSFTFMYNLHEEFIIVPMLIMAIVPIHNKKDTNLLEPIIMKTLKKGINKIPDIQSYLIIFIIMTSYILEKRLIPINANLNYIRYFIVLFVFFSFVKKFIDKSKFKSDKIFYVLLAISIIKALSVIYSYNTYDSIVSSVYWFGLTFLYLTFFNFDFAKKRKDWISLVLVAGGVNAFFSYVQIVFFYFFNLKILNFYGWIHPFGFRVTGLSYDANHLAAFILLPIFISAYYFLKMPKFKTKIMCVLLLIYFAPIFYFSSSRSALIGIFFTLVLIPLFFVLKSKIFTLISKIYFLVIPVFFVIIFLLFYPSLALKQDSGELNVINSVIYNLTKNVVIHGRGLDGSAFAHFSLVYSSFKLQAQHNYLGTGAGNFAEGLYKDAELSNLFKSLDASAFNGGNFPAHSMYGEALGEGGFIGLILFLTLLFLILSKYLKVIEYDRNLFPFFIYFYSICFFMLFYNINEEFFWLFTFLGLFITKWSDSLQNN